MYKMETYLGNVTAKGRLPKVTLYKSMKIPIPLPLFFQLKLKSTYIPELLQNLTALAILTIYCTNKIDLTLLLIKIFFV